MRRPRSILMVLLVALVGLVSCERPESPEVIATSRAGMATSESRSATEEAKRPKCYIQFQAKVYQGPDAGLSLAGDLKTEVDHTGVFSSTLIQESGPAVTVTGQINGRAANFMMALDNEQYLFAVGTLQNASAGCSGVAGGTLTGPQAGDRGDWGGKFLKR